MAFGVWDDHNWDFEKLHAQNLTRPFILKIESLNQKVWSYIKLLAKWKLTYIYQCTVLLELCAFKHAHIYNLKSVEGYNHLCSSSGDKLHWKLWWSLVWQFSNYLSGNKWCFSIKSNYHCFSPNLVKKWILPQVTKYSYLSIQQKPILLLPGLWNSITIEM